MTQSTLRERVVSTANRAATALVALVVILATVGLPVAAASDSGVPEQIQYGAEGQPSYIVHYSNGSLDDLEAWAAHSDRRHIIETDNETNSALVAAPFFRVEQLSIVERFSAGIASLTARPLATRGWVKRVSPNYRLERPDRPKSLTQKSWTAPSHGFVFKKTLPGEGIAFDNDSNRTIMREIRSSVGVDEAAETGDGMLVGVIDTGVNTADGQIFGNGTAGSSIRIDNASKNFVTDAENKTVANSSKGYDILKDGNGHGTWVASAIAANASGTKWDGMAPDARLLILKALADDGSGSTENIADAIRYAADQGVDVLSMSLGSPVYSKEIAKAIEYARSKGVLIVVAVGNSALSRSPGIASPSDVDGVISVAATNGSAPYARAYFSQYGPDPGSADRSGGVTTGEDPDLAAPGYKTVARIATTSGGVKNRTLSGTSMATPVVAGVATVVWSAHDSWNASTVADWLYKTATRLPHASPHEVGHGMPHAEHAINQNKTNRTQEEAMNDTAQRRDQWYEGKSQAMGRWFTQFLRVVDPEMVDGVPVSAASSSGVGA